MKKALKWLVVPVLLLAAAMAQADPIADNAMNPYKAGWYPNIYKGQLMACPQACKAWVGAPAEHELSMGVKSKMTYVCKFGKDRFLYGNQFDGTPICYATDVSGKPQRSRQFFCLCVTPLK